MENNCGIYCFSNLVNGCKYIGKSINIKNRKSQHLTELRNGKHHSHYLQNTFNKYGESSFVFGIVEYCAIELLDSKEKYYIDLYDSYNNGFNEQIPNGLNSGHIFTAEDKARHSIAIKKSRLKWGPDDWAKSNEALLRGRLNSLDKHDRRICIYDCNTFNFVMEFANRYECASYLGCSTNAAVKAIGEFRINKRLSFYGYILIRDSKHHTIESYLKSRKIYQINVKSRNAMRSGLSIVNKFKREYAEAVRVRNNTENRNASWKLNSLKAKDAIRKSGKHAVDIYIFSTGEYVGRWNLMSDFAAEYGLRLESLRKVMCGERMYHKNFVVKKVI